MDVEQHNARAALRWLIDDGNVLASQLADAMSGYWEGRGMQAEGTRWLKEVLESPLVLDLPTRAGLCRSMSNFKWMLGDFPSALTYAHQMLAVWREADAQSNVAQALILMSQIHIEAGDCAQARDVALEALRIGRVINDADATAGALLHLGEAELSLGEIIQAETYFRESHALCQAPDWHQHVWLSLACKGLGEIALIRHEYDRAREFLLMGAERGVFVRLRLLNLVSLAGVIGTMPRRATADVQRAAKIWGATEALCEKVGTQLAPGNRMRIDALIAEARTRIAPKTFAAAWAEGRELSLDEAIAVCLESV